MQRFSDVHVEITLMNHPSNQSTLPITFKIQGGSVPFQSPEEESGLLLFMAIYHKIKYKKSGGGSKVMSVMTTLTADLPYILHNFGHVRKRIN